MTDTERRYLLDTAAYLRRALRRGDGDRQYILISDFMAQALAGTLTQIAENNGDTQTKEQQT